MFKKLCSMLLVLAVLCSCIGAAFVTEASAATLNTDEFIVADWVFEDTVTLRGADNLMQEYSELGITDIFLLCKGTNGTLAWQSSVDGAKMMNSDTDALKDTCTAAKKYGIRVHAWMVVGQDVNYITQNPSAIAYHFRHGTGDGVTQFADIRDSGYRTYYRNLIKELNSYDIAGIHFDYIRYANIFYDWGASARNVLINDYGITKAEYNAATMAMARTAAIDYSTSYYLTTNSDGYYVYSTSGTTPSGVGFASALSGSGSTDALNGAKKIAKMRKDNIKSFITEVTQDLSSDNLVSCAIMPESVSDPFAQASYCQDPAVMKDVCDFVVIMSYVQEYGAANTWTGTLAEECAEQGCNVVAAIQTFDSTSTSTNPTNADIYAQYTDVISTRNTVNASSSSGKILGIAFFRAAKTTLASATVSANNTLNFKVHAQDELETALTKITFTMKNGVKINSVSNKSGWGSASFSISSDKTTLTITNSSGMLKSYGSASFDMTYTGTVSVNTGACIMKAYNSSGEDYAFCNTIFPNHEHSYSKTVTTVATCKKDGLNTYTCSCGDSYVESVPALGHSYDEGVVTLEPTCSATGTKTFTCTRCAATLTETIAMTAHEYVSSYDDSIGATIYTCMNCSATYQSGCGEVHTRVETWETGANTHFAFCYNCSIGQEYSCHFEVSETVKATCTEDGYVTYVCAAHRDTATGDLVKDAFSGAGCTNTYTETLPAGCTYSYISNLDGTHSYVCSACGKVAETADCTAEGGSCALCGYTMNDFTFLHFKENSPETTWNWQLAGSGSKVLFDSTSYGAMVGTTASSVANPYFYVAQTDPCALNHVVAADDVVEVRFRMNVTSNDDYISGVTPEIRLQTGNNAFRAETGNAYMGVSTYTDDWQTVQIPIVGAVYQEGFVINRILFDPWSSDSTIRLGATFDIDYIYIGHPDKAPTASPDYIYFDFTNSAEAIRRYNNNVYEGNNFDLIPWAYNSNRSAKPTFDYANEGTLSISSIAGNYIYLQTTTRDGGLNQTPLNYLVNSGDIVEMRFKTKNLVAASGTTPSARLYYLLDESSSSLAGVTLSGVDANFYISGEYVIVSAPLAAIKNRLISSIRPHLEGIADDGSGKGAFIIDYIYVGPADSKPSDNLSSLYFTFDNTEDDRVRYDSNVYGFYDYDQGGWGVNETRNELPTFNHKLGTMETVVKGSNPYLQVCADSTSLMNCPLNFNPKDVEMVQVRFKLNGMEAYNADGEANPNFAIKFVFDDDTQAITAENLTYPLSAADLDGEDFITATLPVGDFMQGYSKITSVQVVVNDVRAISGETATVTYDYIYVGPKKDGINFINFYNEDGTVCLSKTIVQSDVALTFTGDLPVKPFTSTTHYEFNGWVDASGNVIDIATATITKDMDLFATFKAVAHKLAYVSDDVSHQQICDCGYASDSAPHTWNEGETTVEGNCQVNGEITYTCTECSKTKVEIFEASGHDYTTTVVAPTCSEQGYTTHTCACGASYKDNYTAAFGHDYTVVRTEPTCTTAGSSVSTCGNCGDVITETYAALGHNAVYCPQTAPTCGKVGYEAHYECSNCSKFFIDEACKYPVPASYLAIPALSHNYVEEVTKEATCTAAGEKTIHCDGCGDSRTEVIPATGHKTVYYPDTKATCTAKGCIAHYKCEGCGSYYIDASAVYAVPETYVFTNALGHSFSFKNNGANHSIVCANCDFNVPAAHTYGSNGLCPCGSQKTVDSNLTLSMSIGVGAQMGVNFSFLAANVSAYEDFYIVLTKDVAGSDPITQTYGVTEDRIAMTTSKHPVTGAVLLYRADFNGIAAKEMGDSFEATLYGVKADGTIFNGPSVKGSIKDYLINKLNDSAYTAAYKAMAVDMLKYGAAAQNHFGYDCANLVTNSLTAAQLAYATKSTPAATDTLQITGTGATVNTNVTVGSKVELNLSCIVGGISDTSTVQCVITDEDNKVIARPEIEVKAGVMFRATYDNVGAREMRKPIVITFYAGSNVISQSVHWSLESYVARTRANTSASTTELALANAMLTYGDSVAAYLDASGQ